MRMKHMPIRPFASLPGLFIVFSHIVPRARSMSSQTFFSLKKRLSSINTYEKKNVKFFFFMQRQAANRANLAIREKLNPAKREKPLLKGRRGRPPVLKSEAKPGGNSSPTKQPLQPHQYRAADHRNSSTPIAPTPVTGSSYPLPLGPKIASEYWQTMETYFMDIQLSDLNVIQPDNPDVIDTAFSIPPKINSDDILILRNQWMSHIPEIEDQCAPRISPHSLTARVTGAFIPRGDSSFNETSDLISLPRLYSGPVQKISEAETSRRLESFEYCVFQELESLGLISTLVETEDRQDDEVCVHLRELQRQLKEQMSINAMMKKRVRNKAKSWIPAQLKLAALRSSYDAVEDMFLKSLAGRKSGRNTRAVRETEIKAVLEAAKTAEDNLSAHLASHPPSQYDIYIHPDINALYPSDFSKATKTLKKVGPPKPKRGGS